MKKYTNQNLITSLNLPFVTDIHSLSMQLRLSEKLVYFLSNERTYKKYRIFRIPKKDGTFRTISAPIASLKIVQRWVLENILYKIKVSDYSYGFSRNRKGSPLAACAEKHKNNLFMLKMDLKNFYPSIQRDQVFFQFLNIGYNTYAANLLTNICYNQDGLPQGAVTSPYLANMICYKMDVRIASYCNKRDITYTRYADDLAFSSDNRDSLRNIYGMIKKIVEDEGFSVNDEKTCFMTPKNHKVLLGVTINDANIKVPRQMKKMVRIMIHRAVITGDYSRKNVICGYVSYIDSIEKGYKDKIKKYIHKYYEDPITLFKDAVDAYNKNKFYEDMLDMENRNIDFFLDGDEWDEDEVLTAFYEEREAFLITHK